MKNILMIQYQRKKQTINSLLEYHMAGDERIELPTVVLENFFETLWIALKPFEIKTFHKISRQFKLSNLLAQFDTFRNKWHTFGTSLFV